MPRLNSRRKHWVSVGDKELRRNIKKGIRMKCPHCHSHISIAHLITESKQQHVPDEVQASGKVCPACNNRIYYCFSKFWLWSATFFTLLGLSKIGHLQMNYHYALQSYIILSVCGIILPSVRLTSTPGPLEQSGASTLRRINIILYLLLCGFAVFAAADIYTNIPPVKSSLIEIKGRIKETAIRNGRFSFVTLNTSRNIEFIVNDQYDSPAAHLQPGASVSLFVDKTPNITGDSYNVWEVRDDMSKVLLPYEDLRIIRGYEAVKTRAYYPIFFVVLLLGYLGTKYLLKQKDAKASNITNYTIDNGHISDSSNTSSYPIDYMETKEPLEHVCESNNNQVSINSILEFKNLSIKNVLAFSAILSVVMFVFGMLTVSLGTIKLSVIVFAFSVLSLILVQLIKYTIFIYTKSKVLFTVILILFVGVICLYLFDLPNIFYEYTRPPAIAKTTNTSFTAHLEEPLTSTSNMLYCASFQKAWDKMRNQVVKAEIRLEGDPQQARQLNRLMLGNDDISPDSYVAEAGTFSHELVDRVNRKLRDKFGNQANENLDMPQALAGGRSIIAYAFLYKNLEFPTQFEKLTNPLVFQTNGHAIPVMAFGIELFTHSKRLHEKLASQIAIYDYRNDDDFILSLISKSKDDEIILAKVKPGKTLMDTYQAVAKRIASDKRTEIWENESLKIPKLDFDLSHNFAELEGKRLLNRGWEEWHIATAVQDIRFKLDEKGAVLKSRAFIMAMKGEAPPMSLKPRMFIFDKPFLVCLKQKKGSYPYFALWINNPELMLKMQ